MKEPVEKYYVYVFYDARPEKLGVPIYVGKGSGNRMKKHLNLSSNVILQRILEDTRRLGLEPDCRIVHRFSNENDAYNMEMKIIREFKRIDQGGTLVNFTDGGEGGLNPTLETRERMSLSHKGKKWTPETRTKLLIARKNMSDETKKKLSESGKGRKWTDESKAKLVKSQTGKKASEAAKAKMSLAKKGKKLTQEHRQNMGKSRKGIQLSEETRRKISESNKGKKISDETRKKLRDAKQNISQETRDRMSESAKLAMTDERRAHLAELARNMSKEQREIISKSNKSRKISEETRAKMSLAQIARHKQ
jgi:hypothetical protein